MLSSWRTPTIRDVIARTINLTINQKKTISDATNIVGDEVIEVWREKKPSTEIITKHLVVKKIKLVYGKYDKIKKNINRSSKTEIDKRNNFAAEIDDIFNIAKQIKPQTAPIWDNESEDTSSKQTGTEISSASNFSDTPDGAKQAKKHFTITPQLVKSLDNAKLSNNNATSVILSCAHYLGIDTSTVAVSASTMYRQRKRIRQEISNDIKESFGETLYDSFIVLHWDGKILPKWNATEDKKDNLAVVLSNGKETKILGVAQLHSGMYYLLFIIV